MIRRIKDTETILIRKGAPQLNKTNKSQTTAEYLAESTWPEALPHVVMCFSQEHTGMCLRHDARKPSKTIQPHRRSSQIPKNSTTVWPKRKPGGQALKCPFQRGVTHARASFILQENMYDGSDGVLLFLTTMMMMGDGDGDDGDDTVCWQLLFGRNPANLRQQYQAHGAGSSQNLVAVATFHGKHGS